MSLANARKPLCCAVIAACPFAGSVRRTRTGVAIRAERFPGIGGGRRRKRMTDPRTQDDVSALSDAELTQAVTQAVMGWKQTRRGRYYFWKGENDFIGVLNWNPLTDANDRDRVVERLREVWRAEGSERFWRFEDDEGKGWEAFVLKPCRYEGIETVSHSLNAHLGRAICEAAVWDRMKGEAG
jgi:hypothetical protein